MTQHDSNQKRPGPGEKSQPHDGGASVLPDEGKLPWLCLLLGFAVFWTFFPVINNDFVNYDDITYVTENIPVQQGLTWAGVEWAFRSSTASNWHPLTWLSHMLDCQLYGLHPWGHHLTSVLLHTINTLLLFLVLRRMVGATWRSLGVAMLFGLHPLHVQSVAWVSERKDVLSTLFWLLTLWAYVRYVEKSEVRSPKSEAQSPVSGFRPPTSGFYWLALGFFALGLMSKPMLVTLPFVLLLLDYWPLGRVTSDGWRVTRVGERVTGDAWRVAGNEPSLRFAMPRGQGATVGSLVVEKIPFLLLSLVASVVTFLVQKSGGAVATFARVSFSARMENALVSYVRYLGKLFWPEPLAILYPYPGGWPAWVVPGSALLLLGITILAVMLRQRRPYLPVGWFWFVGTLVPVIGLVQVGEQSMADRYMYVPMIGVLILLIWGLHDLIGRRRYGTVALFAAAAAAAILCALATRQQIGYWKDSETLFRHEIAVAGDTPTAHYKLGVALNEKGDLDGAARLFQEALKLNPDDFHSLYALGIIASSKGQLDEAVSLFQEVLKLKPDYADAHYRLGLALGKRGQLDEALGQYQEALRLNPDYLEAHMSLGVALARKGQLDEAISQFQAAVKLSPKNIGALYNLGLALYTRGQLDEAVAAFKKVIELKPNFADAHNNLGLVFSKKGEWDKAIDQFQEALRLNPNHTSASKNMAAALTLKGASLPPVPKPPTGQSP